MATGEHVVELAEPEVVVRLSTTQLPACHPAPPPLLDSDPKDPKLPSVLSSASVADVSERPLQDLIENSPFLDTTSPITAYEMFKMCILLPWTLIRFVLLIIIMPFVWATTHVLMLGWDRSQPMSPARSWLVGGGLVMYTMYADDLTTVYRSAVHVPAFGLASCAPQPSTTHRFAHICRFGRTCCSSVSTTFGTSL